MIAGFLPSETDVTDREATILGYFNSYTSAGRKEEFSRMNVKPSEIESLAKRGYVKVNKRGATSITTKGKNAAGRVY
jgi:Mn-dependent DtxR family transcriptional regulator